MGNLKLSKTAIRELTRLYRGVLVAAIVATAIAATSAKAADETTLVAKDGSTEYTVVTTGTSDSKEIATVDKVTAEITSLISSKETNISNMMGFDVTKNPAGDNANALKQKLTGDNVAGKTDIVSAINAAGNAIGDLTGTGVTGTTVADQIATLDGAKLEATDITSGTAQGAISVAGTSVSVYGLGNAAYTGVATAVEDGNANLVTSDLLYDQGYQTAANVKGLIDAAAGNGLTSTSGVMNLDLTTKGGLQFDGTTDGSKTLSVATDDSTIVKDTTSGALKVGTIGFGNIDTNNIADGTTPSTKLTTQSYVDEGLDKKQDALDTENGGSGITVTAATGSDPAKISVNAGNGLQINTTSNAVEVKASNGIAVDGSGVAVKLASGTTKPGLGFAEGGLAVITDNSTLEVVEGGVRIKASGVTSTELKDQSVTLAKLNGNVSVGDAIKNDNRLVTSGGLYGLVNVDAGTYTAISSGTNVAQNLIDLDSAVGDIADIIGTVQTTAIDGGLLDGEKIGDSISIIDAIDTVAAEATGKSANNEFTGANTFKNDAGIVIKNSAGTADATLAAKLVGAEKILDISGANAVSAAEFRAGDSVLANSTLTIGKAAAITGSTSGLNMGANALTNIASAAITDTLNVGGVATFGDSTDYVKLDSGTLTTTGGATIGGSVVADGASKFGKIGTTSTYVLDMTVGSTAAESTLTSNAVVAATQGVKFGSDTTAMTGVGRTAVDAKPADTATDTANKATVASLAAVQATRAAINAENAGVFGSIYNIDTDDGTLSYKNDALAADGFVSGKADLTASLVDYAANVETATGGTFATDGKWSATVTTGTSNGYTYTASANLMDAINQVASNIGTAAELTTTGTNGVADDQTVNANIDAVNATIGDMDNLENTFDATAHVGNAITNGGASSPTTVVDALNNIDATLGMIHGLKANGSDLGDKSNLADGTTVEQHLVSLDNAIGDLTQLVGSHYASDTTNVADSMMALDSNLNRVEGKVDALDKRVNKMHHEMKSGFASLAAMSSLVPNARSAGDTQIAVGAGYYRGTTGLAIGAFHHINDNVLLNAGASYGGNGAAVFKGGVTFGF